MAKKKITPEQIAGLGLVGIIGYFLLTNGSKMIDAISGGGSGTYSGYSGSGTDLSGIPAGFFTETPPVFNITNTPPDSFFSTPMIPNTDTEYTTTKKGFEVLKTPVEVLKTPVEVVKVGNTTNSNLTNIFNPKFWFGSWGKDLSDEEYSLRQQNNARFAIFKTPTDFINAGVNPLGFLINRFKSTSGSGGGGGGCRSGNCPRANDTPFTIDLTTKKTAIINSGNTGVTAQSFLTSLRNEGIAPRTITYTQNIMTPMEYGDYYNKKLAVIEQNAQNKLATSLASGNCGPAISTNACSGKTRTTNYSNIVSNTANQSTRYYENTIATTKKELITVEMSG